MSTLDDQVKLGAGDEIRYRVIEDRDDPVALIIDLSGEIKIPYSGRIKAAGKTCRQLANEIKSLLESEHYKRATVVISIEQTRKILGTVYVVGAVTRPGPVTLTAGERPTVSKVILAAGGFAPFGDTGKVKLIRKTGDGPKDKKEIRVDVGAVLEKGRLEEDVEVQGGDMVIVSEKLINF